MTQMKAAVSKSLAVESVQAIHFLTTISDVLKLQRRHFDDAVVTHCIRLINDFVEEKNKEALSESNLGANANGRRL